MRPNRSEHVKKLRYLIAPILAAACTGLLFHYLNETLLLWRIVLSALLFLSTFVLIDGFFRFE
jgi:hypothetical protein